MNETYFTLRNKIIWLACGLTLFVSLLIGGYAFNSIKNVTIDTAIQGLAGETRQMTLKFRNAYKQMENDALILQQTPPIKGLIRTQDGQEDSLDGSTRELWKTRLETIFRSVMRLRPHYTQMRYIGVKNNGQELVRVNRKGKKLLPVSHAELQEKAGEPYFKQGILLHDGKSFFSKVTYNREHGKVDSEKIPTVRLVIPVYHEGEVFGLIVINADYSKFLDRIFQRIKPERDTAVVSSLGDYAQYSIETNKMKFYFHEEREIENFPDFVKSSLNSIENEIAFTEGDKVSYLVRLNLEKNNPESFLSVILTVPKKELLAQGRKKQTDTIALIIGLIILCLIIAFLASEKMTAPLTYMTNEILDVGSNYKRKLNLPTHLSDEIGDLARAFMDLTRHLQKSDEKSRSIIENIVDGIITFDHNGKLASFNVPCEKIFECSREKALTEKIDKFISDPRFKEQVELVKTRLESTKSNSASVNLEIKGKRLTGATFPMELSLSAIRDGEGWLYIAVLRDITERKQVENMKNEFVALVNHQLRTPLTSILGSLGLLKVKAEKNLDPKEKKLLEISYANCERLSKLVSDILDVEKIDSGRMPFDLKPTEMGSLVRTVIGKHQSEANQHKVGFILNLKAKDVYCKIDKNRFEQALGNILSNAIKFSPAEQKVKVTVFQDDKKVITISIEDEGAGIPVALHKNLFERFAKNYNPSSPEKSGTGLGLNISKSIIEAFGGKISFETDKEKGTMFYLILPACSPENTEEV